YDLVWNLPEVKREIQAILDDGGIPFSTVAVRPEPGSRPEGKNSYYVISLRAIRTKDVMVDLLFSVNAFSGKMSVYDASAGSFISIEDWRRQQK
ncbi:MAG: hypothetical protein L7F78_25575, partial [Syntrophales bacterium LBB04]|nr:hypothetical protein [Syntrophales bacterium LBB04]